VHNFDCVKLLFFSSVPLLARTASGDFMTGETNWLSILAIIISIGIPAAIWFARTWIKSWVDDRISSKSAKEIETLKSDLNRERQSIADLRNSAISGSASRQALFDQNRLDALIQLWTGVRGLDRYRSLSEMLQNIKIDVASESIDTDPKIREFFQVLQQTHSINSDQLPNTVIVEPLIPKGIFSLYSAYQSVIYHGVLVVLTLANGLSAKKFLKNEQVIELVISILPHQKAFIDEHGYSSIFYLTDEIREKLVAEFRFFVEGAESDEEYIRRIAEIAVRSEMAVKAELENKQASIPSAIFRD
jgi:hypothetical protein